MHHGPNGNPCSATSGFCILENKKLVIINRFFETEGRILALLDIIQQLQIDEDKLNDQSLDFYHVLKAEIEKSEMV